MKKFLLINVLALFATWSFAQGDIKNITHFNIIWAKPILNFGEELNKNSSENLPKFYKNTYQNFQHIGAGLEFGGVFYIHPTGFIDGFKLGVLVDFLDLSTNVMRYKDSTVQVVSPNSNNVRSEVAATDLFGRFSANVGPVITISPQNGIFFDLYAKLRPTVALNYFSAPMYDGVYDKIYTNALQSTIFDNNGYEIKHKTVVDETFFGFGLLYSFGLNVRLYKVTLGAEFVTGNIKFSDSNPTNFYDKTLRNQMLNIKIGTFFGE